jgi:hypothetical protein
MKKPHLTVKNACLGMTIICGVIIATIAAVVPAPSLGLSPWKWIILVCAVLGIGAAIVLIFKQSSEDRDLGKKIDRLLADRGLSPETPLPAPTLVPLVSPLAPALPPPAPNIDGEVYRLVTSPRSVAWPIVRDVFRLQGRPDDAVVDTDILVEMYLVNRDAVKKRYVRDIRLSAEVNSQRVEFKRQDNLWADDFNDVEFEYGLKEGQGDDVEPIKQLSDVFPLPLAPEQPVEGWLRFMAKEINADKITQGTVTLTITDSLGNEYPITKAATDRERRGEIGLRRRRS